MIYDGIRIPKQSKIDQNGVYMIYTCVCVYVCVYVYVYVYV